MHSYWSWGVSDTQKDGTSFILHASQLKSTLSSHSHSILTIAVEEIEDRSKRNFIAKTVVVVQMLWFALQVLIRVIQGLPITGLEFTTLRHTVLNIFIYCCWWCKPVNASPSKSI